VEAGRGSRNAAITLIALNQIHEKFGENVGTAGTELEKRFGGILKKVSGLEPFEPDALSWGKAPGKTLGGATLD